MRISDWSSDVCSSDLTGLEHMIHRRQAELVFLHLIGGNRRGVLEALAIAAAKDVEADRELIAAHLRIGGVLRRSEEHTSELQSLMRISYAVFCLKKKKEV